MEITPDPPEWDASEDRAILKQFLDTRTGRRLVPKLLESCPSLLPGGDTNAILIRAGELRGVQLIVHTLFSLVSPGIVLPDLNNAEEYPSLTDDEAWKDNKNTPTE